MTKYIQVRACGEVFLVKEKNYKRVMKKYGSDNTTIDNNNY